eukprot:scaffold9410_cov129-Isochrysis_galbana.AAC.1
MKDSSDEGGGGGGGGGGEGGGGGGGGGEGGGGDGRGGGVIGCRSILALLSPASSARDSTHTYTHTSTSSCGSIAATASTESGFSEGMADFGFSVLAPASTTAPYHPPPPRGPRGAR